MYTVQLKPRSSTPIVLSIFLPHTSMKCGRTATALEFSWMVGKVSLSQVANQNLDIRDTRLLGSPVVFGKYC